MASTGDVGHVSDLVDVESGPVEGDPEPPVGIPLGLEVVNPEDLVNNLTFGIELGTRTSISLLFTSGLDFESSVASLSGFVPGLDPLLGLSEGEFSCLGSEPRALFADDCWGTQQNIYWRSFLVLNSPC
jgi:hypothetical protein